MQIEQMPMVRVFFQKTGRAKYTSHLDTARTLSRAFKRSGLPCWYTQGFNPHLYMTFALPIALGYESMCESVDIRLTEEADYQTIVDRLNKALPPGFCATRAAEAQRKPSEIAWADYDVRLIYCGADMDELLERLGAFLRSPVIDVLKKTKKGEKLIDIKPLCEILSSKAEDGALLLKMRLRSGNEVNINPTLWLKAFYDWANLMPDGVKITRTAILDEILRNFAEDTSESV